MQICCQIGRHSTLLVGGKYADCRSKSEAKGVVCGEVATYYIKQLAQHAALVVTGRTKLDNQIIVRAEADGEP